MYSKDDNGQSIFNYLERMIVAECSQPAVNVLLKDVYSSISLIDLWSWYYLAAVLIHFIIDFYPSN